MSTKVLYIPIIPRFIALGFMATRTYSGSTAVTITLFVWKVSAGISLHTYA